MEVELRLLILCHQIVKLNMFQVQLLLIITFLVEIICFRYRKLEEMRLEKEHNFLREQAILESEGRKQEREHELKMLSMMMGNVSQVNHLGPNLHAVYHANPYPPIHQHNIVKEQDKTFFQF